MIIIQHTPRVNLQLDLGCALYKLPENSNQSGKKNDKKLYVKIFRVNKISLLKIFCVIKINLLKIFIGGTLIA